MHPSLPSAKRTPREKSGVHSWHPYYAGYSESFVLAAINHLGLKKGQTVVDPWIGSGTTNLVCEKSGLNSFGFDLNPVMTIFANAKHAPVAQRDEREISNIVESLFQATRQNLRKVDITGYSELSKNIKPQTARRLVALTRSISNREFDVTKINSDLSNTLSAQPMSMDRCFFQAAAFILAREIAGTQRNSNPTWIKGTLVNKKSPSYCELKDTYTSILRNMRESSIENGTSYDSEKTNIAIVGNSKNLPIQSESFDAVIGSPPYLTRIDYAVSTRIELAMLVGDYEYSRTRKKMMGSTTVPSSPPVISDKWGTTCCDCLQEIFKHPSKASNTYYYRNIANYFNDAFLSIVEVERILKPGARALIVVQSSYYKDIEIPLGDIYCEMADSLGMDARLAGREIVKNHIAHKNTRSRSYVKDRIYHEDVVELRKPKT